MGGTIMPLLRIGAGVCVVIGILISLVVLIGTLSMGSPLFTGSLTRNIVVSAFFLLPVIQILMVIMASYNEIARPILSSILYAGVICAVAAAFMLAFFA
jgi:hypothetical protein